MTLAISESSVAHDLWSAAFAALERKYTKPIFEMWLKPIRLVDASATEVVLAAQSAFARDWVDNRLKDAIVETLTELLGYPANIRIIVAPDGPVTAAAPARSRGGAPAISRSSPPHRSQPPVHVRRVRRGKLQPVRPRRRASRRRSPRPGVQSPLPVRRSGLGKTHLMHAIGHRVLPANPRANVVYVSSEKFTNEFIIAIKNNQTLEFRNRYRHVDVLLIDDIQFLEGKEQTQEEFFHTFNSLHEASRQLIISSDRPPKEIQTLGEPAAIAFRVGPAHRHSAARSRDARSDPAQESGVRKDPRPRRRALVHRQTHPVQHPRARRRAHSRRCLRVADQSADHGRPCRRCPQEHRGRDPAAPDHDRRDQREGRQSAWPHRQGDGPSAPRQAACGAPSDRHVPRRPN